MKFVREVTHRLYEHGEFQIEIVNDALSWDCWISHKEYGIKVLMFSLPDFQMDLELFEEIVMVNLEEYEIEYRENYMD